MGGMLIMSRRVVVTGMGMVSPLGLNVSETWSQLIEGKSGIDTIQLFDASSFPTQIAGEVKNLDFEPFTKKNSHLAHAGRNTRFALSATQEAFQDSGLDQLDFDPTRLGIYFAAGDGGSSLSNFVKTLCTSWGDNGELVKKSNYLKNSQSIFKSEVELGLEPAMTLRHIAEQFNVRGPISNALTACAASSQAIGEAFQTILRGDADVMITGGSHSMIHPFGVVGFNLLTALSTNNEQPHKASRPFDLQREGFVIAEGSGVLILEELEYAKKRGARIYGELVGYGASADSYRLTDSHPDGRGASKSMELALQSAGMKPEEIDYINAHGTSTKVNDLVETQSIKKVFGEYAYQVPVSSIKSMLGHLIAAAGAVELITSLCVINEGIIPPTINLENKDPECDLDYVPNQKREVNVDVILSNSFGFGGQNVTLIAKKLD